MKEGQQLSEVTEEADEKSKGDEVKPVLIWKLFRYGSCLDLMLVLGGYLFSTIAGAAFPVLVILVGFAILEYGDFILARTILGGTLNGASYFCNNTNTAFMDYLTSSDPDNRFKNRLYEISYGAVGVGIGLFIGQFLANIMWSLVSIRQDNKIKSAFLRAVLNQDVSHYDFNPATELPSLLLEDVQNIAVFIGRSFGEIVFHLSTMVTSLIIALVFDWELALVLFSMVFVLVIVLGFVGKINTTSVEREQSYLTLAASWAEQTILSIKTVIAYGGQSVEETRYDGFLGKALVYSYAKSLSTAFAFGFFAILYFSVVSLGFWYGGQLFISCSGIDVRDMFIVIFGTLLISQALGYAVLPLNNLGVARISGAKLFAVIDKKPKLIVSDDDKKTQLGTFKGNIQLSNVVFAYPARPDVPILQGIDLDIKPGQAVALVGPSGSGKSTIMKLLPRIYEFDEGNILLDGVDIRDISVKWLRSQIGVVSQEPVLFNISIAENIGYGKEGATKEEIEAAAETANAHDFIMDLPDGYETIVGEGGSHISGGQKQRIAIARALVSNPKILLLDEATSALDTKSEKLVQQALDKAREGRTTFIIAHRLSTIQTADVIVAIDKGRVVEMGTHSELMEKQGLYHGLVMSQTKEEEGDDEQNKDFCQEMRKTVRSRTASARRQSHRERALSVSHQRSHSRRIRRSSVTVSWHGVRVASEGLSVPRVSSRRETYSKNVDVMLSEDTIGEENVVQENIIGTGSSSSSLKNFLSLVKPDWWILLVGTLTFALIGTLQCSMYILVSQTIDVFTETDSNTLENNLNLYVYLFAGMGGINLILYLIGTVFIGVGADRLGKRIRFQSFRTILRQDIPFFDKEENSVSALVSHLSEDPKNISEATGIPLGFVIRAILILLVSIGVAFYGSWVIAFITLPLYVVQLAAAILEVRIGRKFVLKSKSYLASGNEVAIGAIENVSTVASLGIAERVAGKYDMLTVLANKQNFAKSVVHGLLYSFAESFVMFTAAAALAVSGVIFLLDENGPFYASFSNIFLAILSALFVGITFKDAFNSLPDIKRTTVSANETSKRLSEVPGIETFSERGTVPDSLQAAIQANAVFFAYPSRPRFRILKGLDISVKPGQTLALVGPSGSGKSTIISLIERFYDPTSGYVQLDENHLSQLSIPWLRQQISLVSQEPVLFDLSIADNIRYGALFREVSDEEMQEAAKSANIHNFIIGLPQGYNTNVGLKGTQLSGGQKQRIAIARALVRNPKILLLDEATSALDTESEKIVQEALEKARKGRTTIVIAHRLTTIQNADCIAVLHKGKVIEQGTHSELLTKRGAYYALVNN